MRLDAAGAAVATFACCSIVFSILMGSEHGWRSAPTLVPALMAAVALPVFFAIERRAENPVLPWSLFQNRSRVATFVALFLSGGLTGTLALVFTLYVEDVLGYSASKTAVSFVPFAVATAVGMSFTPRLMHKLPPRLVVITGCASVIAGLIYASTLHREAPYFPNLLVPLVIGGIGLALISIPLTLALIASVEARDIGPTSAVATMLQNFGQPVVLATVQVVITAVTVHSGGISGSAASMSSSQLGALDHGYTTGMVWLAGIACLIGVVAATIGYTAKEVAHAQSVQSAMNDDD